jgi:hypothetical protein
MKIKSLFFERGNFLFLIISGSLLFALSVLASSGPQASYENLFQPGQSRPGEISGSIYSDSILKIKLSIDFVEFADGTTWGKDVHKSAEKLEGCRAGERAVSDALLPFLNTGGIQAVGEVFELNRLEIEAPPGASPKWAEGFRLGKAVQREKLQRALKSGKPAEVESILRHPLDSYKKR